MFSSSSDTAMEFLFLTSNEFSGSEVELKEPRRIKSEEELNESLASRNKAEEDFPVMENSDARKDGSIFEAAKSKLQRTPVTPMEGEQPYNGLYVRVNLCRFRDNRRPFECPKCLSPYPTKLSLAKHLVKFHRMEISEDSEIEEEDGESKRESEDDSKDLDYKEEPQPRKRKQTNVSKGSKRARSEPNEIPVPSPTSQPASPSQALLAVSVEIKKDGSHSLTWAIPDVDHRGLSEPEIAKKWYNVHKALLIPNAKASCIICKVECNNQDELECHLKEFHTLSEKPEASRTKKLQEPQKTKPQEKKPRFICDKCELTYASKQALNCHRLLHMEVKLKFKCDECGKEMASKYLKDQHYLQSHAGVKYPCEICRKQLSSAVHLKIHKITHLKNRSRDWSCNECSKKFDSAALLKIHKITHLKNRSRDWSCNECSKEFYSAALLKIHKQSHLENRPKDWSCDECGKEFHSAVYLKKHKKTHLENRPHWECSTCGMKFTANDSRELHERNQHPKGERPAFKCDQCEKLLSTKNNLNLHKRTHLKNRKKYACPKCFKEFLKKQSVTSHMKKCCST